MLTKDIRKEVKSTIGELQSDIKHICANSPHPRLPRKISLYVSQDLWGTCTIFEDNDGSRRASRATECLHKGLRASGALCLKMRLSLVSSAAILTASNS